MINPPATHDNWDVPPYNRWALQNIDKILRVAPVSRGDGPLSELPTGYREIDSIPVTCVDGSQTTVRGIVGETATDGFLVIHRGAVIHESYFNEMTPSTLHLSQSMAKSITATLAGIYISQGLIDPDAPLTDAIPELSRCAYSGATLRHVLDMRSGVRFGEDYSDPECECGRLDRASGWKPRNDESAPRTIREFILTLEKERSHGGHFEYRSIETEIIAWMCEIAGGARLPDLLSREIWSKLGAEHGASLTIDAEGTALADGGFNSTLRDYGRFALMHLYEGAFDGNQIVPRQWIHACRSGEQEPFRLNGAATLAHYPKACYSNQWWVLDREKGIHAARGANGQLIYIDPTKELVVVKLSSWPDFLNDKLDFNTHRMVWALAERLAGA